MRTSAARRHGTASTELEVGLEALFRSEFEPMFRLAFTIVRLDEDAEEVVQDAFVAVADRWATIANPGGYLRTTVVNGARRKLRSRGRIEPRFADEPVSTVAIEVPGLLDVLDDLSERQRVAIVLTYYAELSSKEAAAAMGCRAATVRSLVRHGLRRLRRCLDDD